MSTHPEKPPGTPWLSPYLAVRDVQAAADFYAQAFGFTIESVQRGADGKPFHAVLAFHDARIQLGPESGDLKSPKTRGGPTMNHYLYVAAVDTVYERSIDAGATPLRSPRTEFWGDRCCLVADPDGHTWMLATNVPNYDAWKATRDELEKSRKDPSE